MIGRKVVEKIKSMNEKIFIVFCIVVCNALAYILEPGPVVIATKGENNMHAMIHHPTQIIHFHYSTHTFTNDFTPTLHHISFNYNFIFLNRLIVYEI